jgi:glycine cleavage system H protein
MKKKVSKKQNAESADAQNRCIWMTAGVISFKLCPFNYDCEHCDLDKAMRSQAKSRKIGSKVKKQRLENLMPTEKHTTSKRSSKKPFPFFTFSASEMEEGFYLYPAHLWAKRIEGQKWRVGVDELLAYILPPPEKFEFHDLDKDLIQDQVFGKMRTQTGTVLLTAPLSGHLIQTNPRLVQFPELVQKDPYGEGWLAIIKWNQNRSELQKFYTQNSVKRYLEEEAQHLKFLLKHRGVEVNEIGETLPDGGVNIKYLHQILPAKVCLRLAVELMVTGKQAW